MEFFRVSAIVPGVKVEDTAVMLAELFLQHLEESDRVIQPNDTVEELIGWETKPISVIVSFLVAMEEQEVFPKETLSRVETFRELVECVVARSYPPVERAIHRPRLLHAHNSFTNL